MPESVNRENKGFDVEDIFLELPNKEAVKYIVEQYKTEFFGIVRALVARKSGLHMELMTGDSPKDILGGGYLTKDDDLKVVIISGTSTQFGMDPIREWTAEKLQEKYPGFTVEIQ